MRFLEALAQVFINTFGITQPTDAMRRRAAWFIFAMLLVALGVVCLLGAIFYRLLRG